MIDESLLYSLDCCPDCGQVLFSQKADPQVIQQVELVSKRCGSRSIGPWLLVSKVPQGALRVHAHGDQERLVRPAIDDAGGLYERRLSCLVFHDPEVSPRRGWHPGEPGYTAKVIAKVTQWLTPAYEELLARLPSEAFLNVDETGHKENAKKFWTWCFRAELYALFRIEPSRGSGCTHQPLWAKNSTACWAATTSAALPQVYAYVQCAGQFAWHSDPRREISHHAAGQRAESIRGANSRKASRSVCCDPPTRRTQRKRFAQKLEAARAEILSAATTKLPQGKHAAMKRFHSTAKPTSSLSLRRASSRQTTWRNKQFDSW